MSRAWGSGRSRPRRSPGCSVEPEPSRTGRRAHAGVRGAAVVSTIRTPLRHADRVLGTILSVATSRVLASGTAPGTRRPWRPAVAMLIDCDRCVMRDLACSDCVVTVLLGPPPESGFDDEERRALGV